jgi:predicted nuclease with TOPRIM domain
MTFGETNENVTITQQHTQNRNTIVYTMNTSSNGNSKVRTVKLNLRTIIGAPRESSDEMIIQQPKNSSKSIQHYKSDSSSSPKHNVVKSILRDSGNENNAFLESLMRQHENSVRQVVADANENSKRLQSESDQKMNDIIHERDQLRNDNDKLRNTNSLLTMELVHIRSDLLKVQSENKRLEQNISDIEELMLQQEDIHEKEMRKYKTNSQHKESSTSNNTSSLRDNSSRRIETSTISSKAKHTAPVNRKKLSSLSTLTKFNTSNNPEQDVILEENKKSTVTTTVVTSNPRNTTNHQTQSLLEEKYAQLMQSQVESQDKLVKREQQLSDMRERYKQLQHEMSQLHHMTIGKPIRIHKNL